MNRQYAARSTVTSWPLWLLATFPRCARRPLTIRLIFIVAVLELGQFVNKAVRSVWRIICKSTLLNEEFKIQFIKQRPGFTNSAGGRRSDELAILNVVLMNFQAPTNWTFQFVCYNDQIIISRWHGHFRLIPFHNNKEAKGRFDDQCFDILRRLPPLETNDDSITWRNVGSLK